MKKIVKKFNLIKSLVREVASYKSGSLNTPYFPTALWIEPTNKCNLKCIMCPNSISEPENPGFMDMYLFEKIIDESAESISYITLNISGEALLHKSLPAMVRYAKEKGVAVYLSTNATILSKKKSKELLEAGLDWVNFSFDGVTRETYERVRVNAKFDVTLKNIKNFLELKKLGAYKTQTELQVILVDNEARRDFDANSQNFMDQFNNLPLDSIQTREPGTWGNNFVDTNDFIPKKMQRSVFSPCSFLWSSMHIAWNGKVVACGSDFFQENVLGEFPKESLSEIWNGEKMVSFRSAMVNEEYLQYCSVCNGCDAIWEKRVLGLPSGMRGIVAITVSNIFGANLLKIIKRIVKFIDRDFVMNVLKK